MDGFSAWNGTQVRAIRPVPLLEWSKSADNLMQEEINSYKVAVGNYYSYGATQQANSMTRMVARFFHGVVLAQLPVDHPLAAVLHYCSDT
jgi:hypothetical protein